LFSSALKHLFPIFIFFIKSDIKHYYILLINAVFVMIFYIFIVILQIFFKLLKNTALNEKNSKKAVKFQNLTLDI